MDSREFSTALSEQNSSLGTEAKRTKLKYQTPVNKLNTWLLSLIQILASNLTLDAY